MVDWRQLFVEDNQPPNAAFGGCPLNGIPLSNDRHLGNLGMEDEYSVARGKPLNGKQARSSSRSSRSWYPGICYGGPKGSAPRSAEGTVARMRLAWRSVRATDAIPGRSNCFSSHTSWCRCARSSRSAGSLSMRTFAKASRRSMWPPSW